MATSGSKPATYEDAGVSIDRGNSFVQRIAPLAAATHPALAARGAALLSGIGAFAAAVQLPKLNNPVIAAATDGVGTKLELAREDNTPESLAAIGQDAVAMCVNDLLCVGLHPLFFLDYIACAKLNETQMTAIVNGIARACANADCALIGGETAEMPSTYTNNKFDIAGFAVGIGEKQNLFTAATITNNDALIAIASDGAHSNGYSLIRRLLANHPDLAKHEVNGAPIRRALLRPTRLYVRPIAALRNAVAVKALAHITGGGLAENLSRIIPPQLRADINYAQCPMPPLFAALQSAGNITENEMRRVFNCGIGMVAIVAATDANAAITALNHAGETAWHIGALANPR